MVGQGKEGPSLQINMLVLFLMIMKLLARVVRSKKMSRVLLKLIDGWVEKGV